MTRILFVCHGNICRSRMAEFAMKELVKKAGIEDQFQIASAATSAEEVGNPVYPPARRKLAEHGISCAGKNCPAGEEKGLCRLRSADRHGSGKYPKSPTDLWWGPGWEDSLAAGICGRPGTGGGRSLVYRGFRGHLAGCSGGMPRDTQGAGGSSGTGKLIVLRQKVSITLSFKFDGSVLRWAYSAEYATDSAIP